MWISPVFEHMLTLHLASPLAHRRIPFQSRKCNVLVTHRSNAMFIHISISNVTLRTVQSVRLAVTM